MNVVKINSGVQKKNGEDFTKEEKRQFILDFVDFLDKKDLIGTSFID